MIAKTAGNVERAHQPLYFYNSARDGFLDILNQYNQQQCVTLLLPGYIGFSPNEGSGIYDPVIKSGINHVFYPVDRSLNVCVDRFEQLLGEVEGRAIVLLVHYFGYPDQNIDRLAQLCRSKNAVIIEDSAHALYTDYVDHSCGQYADYCLYSLHKMLPYHKGGMLKVRTKEQGITLSGLKEHDYAPFDYDFYQIARHRKKNAKLWNELLKDQQQYVQVLRPYTDSVTPQTFPIIVKDFDRNQLYFKLNEAGFGAVSLYHTMIEPVRNGDFADAVWLSGHIINMPVHQDADDGQIVKMAEKLIEIVKG